MEFKDDFIISQGEELDDQWVRSVSLFPRQLRHPQLKMHVCVES
jgi:hypothetical protein